MKTFPQEQKTSAAYLDLATNDHGAEKGLLAVRALGRVKHARPRMVEIGPGGGSAVEHLAAQLRESNTTTVDLTLIEAPGVVSQSLLRAIDEFGGAGSCVLTHGLAQDIGSLLSEPVDVISASALMHEVYSYGGGYGGLRAMMRTLPTVLRPGGFFAYRDIYAVDAPSLHERVVQSYGSQSWLLFLRMFARQYLDHGTHPYHHLDDELVADQNSRIVPVGELDIRTCAVITAPVGLFREVQRHYITLRDHVWRSGVLGFRPVLDGQFAADWLDFAAGHKRVHFAFTETDWLSDTQKAMLRAVSEPYADHFAVDGDIFDEATDLALKAFLAAAEQGETDCLATWEAWLAREGRETYAYMTADELLATVATHSVEARCDTVLIPVAGDDILTSPRHYYNRFLTKRLSNPLPDGKQLMLFQNVPLRDTETLMRGLSAIQTLCSKTSLARVHAAIHSRG
ncbi:class I SAM-dependent methyltransferase [Nocardia australiensis]|uniref:class I SAM-dependent methyltransferase n=1 Tax=Nocardia australiensis TaxID=2887191 RepID=UPI001D15DFF9|nr:class I SAM-dependent methyltransferase [Nocardia australiensis]